MHAAGLLFLLAVAGCGTIQPPGPSAVVAPSGRPSPVGTVPSGSSLAVEPTVAFADRGRIGAFLAELQAVADATGGIRATGTPGYDASVELAAVELRAIGFTVETPDVAYTGFRDAGSSLRVGNRSFSGPNEVRALIYSPTGTASGPVAFLDGSGCDAGDFAGLPDGAVAVTLEGGCLRRDQAVNAGSAGMAALVVGYPGRGPGEIFRPTLIDPGGLEVPVVSVTDETVAALREAEGDDATVRAPTELEPGTFRNVVARMGDGPRTVIVGAHLDSVFDGPGINDNGSGVAAALEIARGVADRGVPEGWSVRIGLWGGEELGLIGSRAYAGALEAAEVAAYLNLDMAGSVNGLTLVYDEPTAAPGSETITAAYESWLDARGEPHEPVDLGGSSDHAGFTQAGIPTGGLFAGAAATGSAANPSSEPSGAAPDPCYHIGCDDLDNVDIGRVVLFADATLAVVLGLMEDS